MAASPGVGRAVPRAAPVAAAPGAVILPNGAEAGLAVDPGTDTAWVAANPNSGSDSFLYRIDLATATVTAAIPLPLHVLSIAVDTADHIVYVGNPEEQNISVIDEATNAVTGTIPLPAGYEPVDYAYDPANGQLFAGLTGITSTAEVVAINPATRSVAATIPVPSLQDVQGLVVDTTNSTVYVSGWAPPDTGRVVAIDPGTDTVTKTITTPPTGYAVARVNGPASALYVRTDDSLIRYDTVSGAETGHVALTLVIPDIAINAVTGNVYAFTFESGSWYIAQVNAAATAVTGQTPTSSRMLAVDEATNTVVSTGNTDSGGMVAVGVQIIGLSATAAITSPPAATFTTGKAGRFTVTASGALGPVVTETGRLPAGVTLTAAGILSGTPKPGAGGAYKLQLTAGNGLGAPATQAFTLTVDQPTAITSASHATFTHGKHGAFTIHTTGYPAATIKETGTLPRGLRFTAARNGTASISGTPAASARGKTCIIHLTATNKVGAAATQRFTIKVR